MAALAALASACILRLAVGDTSGYEASVRTEYRARRGITASDEIQAEPRAGLSWASGRLSLGVAYSPLLLAEAPALDRLIVMHRVSLSTRWRASRRTFVQSTAQVAYGKNDFLAVQPPGAVGAPGTAPVQPLPTVTTLPYLNAELASQAETAWAGGGKGRVELTGFLSGGATAEARGYLPLQRGGRLGLSQSWALSGRDSLAAELADTVTDFLGGPLTTVGTAMLVWRHDVPPGIQAWAGAGTAVTSNGRRPDEAATWVVLPSASTGLRGPLRGRSLEGAVAVSLAPITDRVSGSAYQRLDLSASLVWRPAAHWTLGAIASGGRGMSGGQAGDAVLVGDLRAAWAARRWLEVAGGLRGLYQKQPTAPLTSGREMGVFLSVSVQGRGRL